MSSLFDDMMMGAKVANVFFKSAKKVGKLAVEGIQKVNESEQFQNLKTDIHNRVTNSETLNNVKNEVQQRFSQFTATQPAAAKKHCTQCGAVLEVNARFCSACGAKQEEPVGEETAAEKAVVEKVAAMEEDPKLRDPEYYEALPTVLENDQKEVPDIFGFQPRMSRPGREYAKTEYISKRERAMQYIPGTKDISPYAGRYHLDKDEFDTDMCIYQDKGNLCVSYYDHVDKSTHLYKFNEWGCGKNVLYGIAQDYSFRFVFQEDDRLELFNYDVFPDLSGLYRCLD